LPFCQIETWPCGKAQRSTFLHCSLSHD
jgi:hypothetical protein